MSSKEAYNNVEVSEEELQEEGEWAEFNEWFWGFAVLWDVY